MASTTLTRSNAGLEPFREPFSRVFDRDLRLMRQMTRDIERMFGDFGMRTPVFDRAIADMTWLPELEIFERDNRFVVRADLPGLKKEDVKVNIQDNVLTLEGERKVEEEVNKEGFHRTERSYGTFFRSVPLPEGVKVDQIDAKFKDGVLEIAIPMEPTKKAVKNVEVKIA